MKFDYVDIGTCDYDVSSEAALEGENSLLVEPIKYYLDRIPDRPKQKKVNLAVSNICGHLPVYFVPDVTINMCNLPAWVRGCNSVAATAASSKVFLILRDIASASAASSCNLILICSLVVAMNSPDMPTLHN